jgi:hypothetical protein
VIALGQEVVRFQGSILVDGFYLYKGSESPYFIDMELDIVDEVDLPHLVHLHHDTDGSFQHFVKGASIFCGIQPDIGLLGSGLVRTAVVYQCLFNVPLSEFESTFSDIEIGIYLMIDAFAVGTQACEDGSDPIGIHAMGFDLNIPDHMKKGPGRDPILCCKKNV